MLDLQGAHHHRPASRFSYRSDALSEWQFNILSTYFSHKSASMHVRTKNNCPVLLKESYLKLGNVILPAVDHVKDLDV